MNMACLLSAGANPSTVKLYKMHIASGRAVAMASCNRSAVANFESIAGSVAVSIGRRDFGKCRVVICTRMFATECPPGAAGMHIHVHRS